MNASSENPRLIQKQLTSSAMFHTPGLFRALQNDYRINGKPRLHAIKTLSNGYGLSREEAAGLLSGAIKSEIDEAAGTVTFTSRCEESPAGSDPVQKPYSVLLLYPDYADDTGYETYYALVEAADPDRSRGGGPAASGRGPGGYRDRTRRLSPAACDARPSRQRTLV